MADDHIPRVFAAVLGGLQAQGEHLVLQGGSRLLHRQAAQIGHRGGGIHLFTADDQAHLGAHRHLGAGLRLGADYGAHRVVVIHLRGDTDHQALPLQAGGGILGGHAVHVLHIYDLGTLADLQGHGLPFLDGAGRARALAVHLPGGVLGVILFFKHDIELVVGGVALDLLPGHAHEVHQFHVRPVAEQGVGGVGKDDIAQDSGADGKGGRHTRQDRQGIIFAFLLFGGRAAGAAGGRLGAGAGFGLLDHFVDIPLWFGICQIFVLKPDAGVLFELLQVHEHGPGAGIAVCRVLGHGAGGNGLQAFRHLGRHLAQRGGGIGNLLDGHRHGAV